MNSLTPNSIHIDHGFTDRTGKSYSGFLGIFQRIGQNGPTLAQLLIMEDAVRENKMIFFGSIDEVVQKLNESR